MAPEDQLTCRTYTHARRYPWVVGKIGGFTLPTQLTPAQLLALVGSFVLLLNTRRAWAHLPGPGNLAVQVALPLLLAWSIRHLRVEGRSPVRALLGYLTMLSAPRLGQVRGRPYREPPVRRLGGRRFFVVPDAGVRK